MMITEQVPRGNESLMVRPAHDQIDGQTVLHTRYCAAPQQRASLHEPRLIHAMLVAAWLGRLFEPLPLHTGRTQDAPERKRAERAAPTRRRA